MSKTTGVYPVYENQFQVGATKADATGIAEMESFGVSISNGIENWTPMEQEGWQRGLMTAKSLSVSVSGKRNVSDEGNDYVAGKAFANGRAAEGYFGWTFPDGTIVSCDEAIYSVTNMGAGDSTGVAPLEFEVQFNGKPTIVPAV